LMKSHQGQSRPSPPPPPGAARRPPPPTAAGAVGVYARVDLVRGPDGAPVVMELELIEPNLFLTAAPGGVDRFVAAVADLVGAG
ncbi:hypothetical protein AB0D46_03920, partial [Streptomyces sp. NPDC048383]